MPKAIFTQPVIEPITLQEAKDHLRIDHNDDDSIIEPLIEVAREQAEHDTNRAFITQTWDLYLDAFPQFKKVIEIPSPPLQSITFIKYLDADGTLQTLADTVYAVDTASEMGRVYLDYGQTWPTIRNVRNTVQIQYVAGYGNNADDVPRRIRQAMLMLLGHLYNNRETTIIAVPIAMIPQSYDHLISPFRPRRFIA